VNKLDEKSILITIAITVFAFLFLLWHHIRTKKGGDNGTHD
jgi:hypothetical protein